MKAVVFGDLHSRRFKCEELFKSIGLMAEDGTRNEGFHVISLGDVVSLGYDEQECDFLHFVEPFIDEWLLGNHEVPAIWWNGELDFMGWDMDPWHGWHIGRDREAEQLVRAKFMRGEYKTATTLGKWLITHAGVSIRHQKKNEFNKMSVEDVATRLNSMFLECLEERKNIPVISDCGQHTGGIFWLRPEYLTPGYNLQNHLPQIIGHTGNVGPCLYGDAVWLIDTPGDRITRDKGGVCALVTEDNGENFDVHWVKAGTNEVVVNEFFKRRTGAPY